jgi:hypothetical protein
MSAIAQNYANRSKNKKTPFGKDASLRLKVSNLMEVNMFLLRSTKYFLIGAPLILAACANHEAATSATDAQVAAANQKADQALATAQQALQQAQQATAQADRQYQRSLQK